MAGGDLQQRVRAEPKVSDETRRPAIANPKLVWTPSRAPSGPTFYTGDFYPRWKGSLLRGALKFQQIRRLVLDGTRVVGEEKLTIGQRVRDVSQGSDGYRYVPTDEDDGALLCILPANDSCRPRHGARSAEGARFDPLLH